MDRVSQFLAKPGKGVTVGYSGVHQAYQLALAAEEVGLLDEFICSLFVGPLHWGGLVGKFLGYDVLLNRACPGLPPSKVIEHPWPFLSQRVAARIFPGSAASWTSANPKFDRWMARHLKHSMSSVFVG